MRRRAGTLIRVWLTIEVSHMPIEDRRPELRPMSPVWTSASHRQHGSLPRTAGGSWTNLVHPEFSACKRACFTDSCFQKDFACVSSLSSNSAPLWVPGRGRRVSRVAECSAGWTRVVAHSDPGRRVETCPSVHPCIPVVGVVNTWTQVVNAVSALKRMMKSEGRHQRRLLDVAMHIQAHLVMLPLRRCLVTCEGPHDGV